MHNTVTTPLTKETESQYILNRQKLKALSIAVKDLVTSGEFESINDALIGTYTDEVHREFHTFWDWKKQGKSVKKGEKAFLIWGRPVDAKVKERKKDEDEDEYSYWPICYLFSNAQVEEK